MMPQCRESPLLKHRARHPRVYLLIHYANYMIHAETCFHDVIIMCLYAAGSTDLSKMV
jgi:hypothetical protein